MENPFPYGAFLYADAKCTAEKDRNCKLFKKYHDMSVPNYFSREKNNENFPSDASHFDIKAKD